MSKTWSHPKLGEWTFDEEYRWWEGTMEIPAFTVFSSGQESKSFSVCIQGEEGAPTIGAVQLLERANSNQKALARAVVDALIADFMGQGPDSGMWWRNRWPEISERLEIDDSPTFENVSPLLQLTEVWVDYGDSCRRKPFIELRFGADFEEEHGVGVLTDGTSILGLGFQIDVEPFDNPPATKDPTPYEELLATAKEVVDAVKRVKKNLAELPLLLDKLRTVKSLTLSNKKLVALPDEIFELTQLEELELANNQLESISDKLGQLTKLRYLDLTNNRLKRLPESIWELRSLENLNVNCNQLEALPASLSRLKQLKSLCISVNKIQELPDLSGCASLKSLYAEQNQLSCLPDSLGTLSQLESLLLSRNRLTTFPESIGDLKKLRTLEANLNQLSSLPESMLKLTLRKLLLDGSHATLGLPPDKLDWGILFPKKLLQFYFDMKLGRATDYFDNPLADLSEMLHAQTKMAGFSQDDVKSSETLIGNMLGSLLGDKLTQATKPVTPPKTKEQNKVQFPKDKLGYRLKSVAITFICVLKRSYKTREAAITVELVHPRDASSPLRVTGKSNFAGDTCFQGPSEHRYELDIDNPITLEQYAQARLVISVKSPFSEYWKFDYRLQLQFEENGQTYEVLDSDHSIVMKGKKLIYRSN